MVAAGAAAEDKLKDKDKDVAPPPTWSDPTTGMDFVWVPPGCFQMGSADGDAAEQRFLVVGAVFLHAASLDEPAAKGNIAP